jgi:putative transposase
MVWFVIALVFSTLLDFVSLGRLNDREKDLEILILRHQLDILERKQTNPIKPSKVEKLMLAVLTKKLKTVKRRSSSQLRNIIRVFQPETILKWRRELVRRKWTQEHRNNGDWPKIDPEVEALIIRLAEENSRWDFCRVRVLGGGSGGNITLLPDYGVFA